MDLEGSENASGAVNQQERLEAYIAGFVDGEGCFHVAIQRNPSTRSGWQLVPEFRISQDVSRAQVLDLARQQIGCGLLRENHRGSKNDHTYVLVVRRRKDLLERVIPFFERNPLLSCKQEEFTTFARIVRAMSRGEHLVNAGFERLAAEALENEWRRSVSTHPSQFGLQNPQRPYAEHTRRSREREDMARTAWRHAEPGRNVLAPDRSCGRW
jgi:hypothetical protein